MNNVKVVDPKMAKFLAMSLQRLRDHAELHLEPGDIWKPRVVATDNGAGLWRWSDLESSDGSQHIYDNERDALLAGIAHVEGVEWAPTGATPARRAAAKAGLLYQETPKPRHTPEPWKLDTRHGRPQGGGMISFVITDAHGKSIANCTSNVTRAPLEIEANGQLLVQAPALKRQRDELLAALKELRESETAFRALPFAPTYEYGQAEKRYRAARADADAAIAHAEGRANG